MTVGPLGRARTRTIYFNGAGPVRSFAAEPSDALEEYWTFQPHKAFAMAFDEDDRWTYGFAYGHPSGDAAAEDALERCRAAAQRRGVDAPCLLLAVDEEPAER